MSVISKLCCIYCKLICVFFLYYKCLQQFTDVYCGGLSLEDNDGNKNFLYRPHDFGVFSCLWSRPAISFFLRCSRVEKWRHLKNMGCIYDIARISCLWQWLYTTRFSSKGSRVRIISQSIIILLRLVDLRSR